jgi:hypothetical protein
MGSSTSRDAWLQDAEGNKLNANDRVEFEVLGKPMYKSICHETSTLLTTTTVKATRWTKQWRGTRTVASIGSGGMSPPFRPPTITPFEEPLLADRFSQVVSWEDKIKVLQTVPTWLLVNDFDTLAIAAFVGDGNPLPTLAQLGEIKRILQPHQLYAAVSSEMLEKQCVLVQS